MTFMKYTTGFVLSLLLTLVAYGAVVLKAFDGALIASLGILAVIQMIVQLVYFLHLEDEAKPRYKLLSYVTMAIVLLILVVGSLWIMANMNYNMNHMTPQQKDDYMLNEHDKGF